MAIDSSLLSSAPNLSSPGLIQELTPQVDAVGKQREMYSLADAGFKYQDEKAAHNDDAILQDYLKNGGDLVTPEGSAKATEDLKGKVSPKYYENLVKYHEGADDRARKMQQYYLGLPAQVAEAEAANDNALTSAASRALDAYKKDFATGGEQVAREHLRSAIQANLGQLGQLKMPGTDKPLMPPEQLNKMVEMSPTDLENYIKQSAYGQAQRKAAADSRLKEAHATYYENGGAQPSAVKEQERWQEILDDPEASAEEKEFAKARLAKLVAPASGGTTFTAQEWDKLGPQGQEAATNAAWDSLIRNRPVPARGGLYAASQHAIGNIAKEAGMSVPELLSASADVKTQLQAKSSIERRIQNVDRAANQLEAEMPVVKAALDKINPSEFLPLSKAEIATKEWVGSPDVVAFKQAADAVLIEMEIVKSGNTSQVHVAQLQRAMDQLPSISTKANMQAWIDNAHRLIKNAKAANATTSSDIMKDINKKLGIVSNAGSNGGAQKKAPADAETFLKNHPETKDKFKAKYGYLPEGM